MKNLKMKIINHEPLKFYWMPNNEYLCTMYYVIDEKGNKIYQGDYGRISLETAVLASEGKIDYFRLEEIE